MIKEIVVNLINKNCFYGYGENSLLFAFCDKPDLKNKCHQKHLTVDCREEFCRQLIREINNKNNEFYGPIDMSKLRILIKRSFDKSALKPENHKKYISRLKMFKSDITNGLKILNAYEKDNGWDLTKIITDKHNGSENQFIYLVEGSNNWLKAPFLLSLWSLMIRLGIRVKTRKSNYESSKNVKSKLIKWSQKSKVNDAQHVRDTIKYWDDLISYYPKIIGRIPNRRLFNEEHAIDGVTRLCLNKMEVNKALYKNLISVHKSKEKSDET